MPTLTLHPLPSPEADVHFFAQDEDIRRSSLSKRLPIQEIIRFFSYAGFTGEAWQTVPWIAPPTVRERLILLVGLGKQKDLEPEILRKACAKAINVLSAYPVQQARFTLSPSLPFYGKLGEGVLPLIATAEGILLGSYQFKTYQSASAIKKYPRKVHLFLDTPMDLIRKKAYVKRAETFAQATALCRDLVNEPPSRMTPQKLASVARRIGNSSPRLTCQVYTLPGIKRLGLEGLLAVSRGSHEKPVFIRLSYKPLRRPTRKIALVGKGITFDSGGLNLKPPPSMETMKDDMAGAAAVLSVFHALSALPECPFQVEGYIPCTENMPGGGAQKPGDIFYAYNKKTVEVSHTDAEGRLVLADALSFAESERPDEIIDIATLTGAASVALGYSISAILGNHEELAETLQAAAVQAGEKFWPLPLEKEYKEILKSSIADIKNTRIGNTAAGTILGGLFLSEFVEKTPWAHLDIAATAWTDKNEFYFKPGATGVPVRTLLNYLMPLKSSYPEDD